MSKEGREIIKNSRKTMIKSIKYDLDFLELIEDEKIDEKIQENHELNVKVINQNIDDIIAKLDQLKVKIIW